jgi:hypothetical protein
MMSSAQALCVKASAPRNMHLRALTGGENSESRRRESLPLAYSPYDETSSEYHHQEKKDGDE